MKHLLKALVLVLSASLVFFFTTTALDIAQNIGYIRATVDNMIEDLDSIDKDLEYIEDLMLDSLDDTNEIKINQEYYRDK